MQKITSWELHLLYIFSIAIVFLWPKVVWSQQQNPILVSVHDIKSHPLDYDNKVIRISGWALSHHMGLSLQSEDNKNAVVLRLPSKDIAYPFYPMRRDGLYNTFDKLTNPDSNSLEYTIHVELDAAGRLLKKDGKLPEEFDVFGQWPIELIVLRVNKIELVNRN